MVIKEEKLNCLHKKQRLLPASDARKERKQHKKGKKKKGGGDHEHLQVYEESSNLKKKGKERKERYIGEKRRLSFVR